MNESNYRISVIMGIFNCASTLPEALDSLLSQTYQNFKVIMCDDGSTDNTYDVARQYSDTYNNFILIKNDKNRGLNYTLNHCLEYADTEFVARMDGDDISLPTRFENEVDFLDKNPEISIVGTSMIHFDNNGDYRVSRLVDYPQKKDFVKGSPFCHATCMIRKNAYDAVGGYSVDEKLIRVEDYDLWVKMYKNSLVGHNILTPLYKMRDDRNAYLRRKFKFRVNEARLMLNCYKTFHLPCYYYLFALKPVVVGLLPKFLYKLLRNN